MKYYEVGVAL